MPPLTGGEFALKYLGPILSCLRTAVTWTQKKLEAVSITANISEYPIYVDRVHYEIKHLNVEVHGFGTNLVLCGVYGLKSVPAESFKLHEPFEQVPLLIETHKLDQHFRSAYYKIRITPELRETLATLHSLCVVTSGGIRLVLTNPKLSELVLEIDKLIAAKKLTRRVKPNIRI